MRLRAEPQARIEHHAQQRPPARQAAAIGEQRIVSENRADAGHDGVRSVTHAMDFGAGNLRGDPARLISIARARQHEAAVERQRGLQRNQRTPLANPPGERLVQATRFGACAGSATAIDLNSGGAQFLQSAARNSGIGIDHGGDDARDACGNQRARAGARASRVAARFEIDVHGCAARVLAGGFERNDFGVAQAVVGVEAFGDHFAVAHEHRADHGIGAGEPPPARGELQSSRHEFLIMAAVARVRVRGAVAQVSSQQFRAASRINRRGN